MSDSEEDVFDETSDDDDEEEEGEDIFNAQSDDDEDDEHQIDASADDPPPVVHKNATILQGIKGLISIFETVHLQNEIKVINREELLPFFMDDCLARENVLLHDDNFLKVLYAIRNACVRDPVIMSKLNSRTLSDEKMKEKKKAEACGKCTCSCHKVIEEMVIE